MIKSYLAVKKSKDKGRGVFATDKIRSGTVIEVSPVIVLSPKDRKVVDQTLMHDYIFEWGETRRQACVALGLVSLYNHSYDANCEYEMDFDKQIITIRTIKPIKKGEELFINYNGVPDSENPLWFEAV